jgi:hypothetical protein
MDREQDTGRPIADREEARQGQIMRKRPMTRVLGASLALAVVALVIIYLVIF